MRYDNDPMTWIGRHGFSGNPEQVQAGFDLLNAASLLRDQAAVLESCHQGDLVQMAGIVSRHLREVLDLLDGLHGDERPPVGTETATSPTLVCSVTMPGVLNRFATSNALCASLVGA